MENISDLSISKTGKVTVGLNSLDAIFLDPTFFSGSSATLSKTGANTSVNSSLGSAFGNIETGTDNVSSSETPQLADISATTENYIDSKGITRSRIIIKVLNSSGQDLIGVDTKIVNLKEGAA